MVPNKVDNTVASKPLPSHLIHIFFLLILNWMTNTVKISWSNRPCAWSSTAPFYSHVKCFEKQFLFTWELKTLYLIEKKYIDKIIIMQKWLNMSFLAIVINRHIYRSEVFVWNNKIKSIDCFYKLGVFFSIFPIHFYSFLQQINI